MSKKATAAPVAPTAPATPLLDVSKYNQPVAQERAVTSVKTEVGNELTDDYMSLSSVASYVRKRPTHVQRVLDEIAQTRSVNGKLIHEAVNVGTLSVSAFFLTEKEAERTRFSVKQYLNILSRVAKSRYTLEDIQKMRGLKMTGPNGEMPVKYLHQVPAEVIKTFVGK